MPTPTRGAGRRRPGPVAPRGVALAGTPRSPPCSGPSPAASGRSTAPPRPVRVRLVASDDGAPFRRRRHGPRTCLRDQFRDQVRVACGRCPIPQPSPRSTSTSWPALRAGRRAARRPQPRRVGGGPGAGRAADPPRASCAERVDEVPAGEPLYVICALRRPVGQGRRATSAASGVDAVNVAGGTKAWVEAGHPVESGPG